MCYKMKYIALGMLLVITGSIYGFMLFIPSICNAASYPTSTTTPLATDLSMNQYKLNDAGDIITKGPWVDARAYNGGAFNDITINAAITAIGANKKTLLLAPGTWTISANVTVPSNISLKFEQGAILSIVGVTFTINGPIDTPIVQIYSGSGTVSFGVGYVKEVYPQWWGAKGDGTNDDKPAINSALTSGCPRICFVRPSVAYKLDSGLTIGAGVSSLSLVGEPYGVELRYTPTSGQGITFAGAADNFTMKNITLKAINNSSGTAILSSTASLQDTIFENVSISGFWNGIVIAQGQNGKITGGRYTGQGKLTVGSVGIYLGESVTQSYKQGLIEGVYISSYETGIYNKYCDVLHVKDAIIRTTSVALKNGTGVITYADNLNVDSTSDTMINNDTGYVLYRSTGSTQPITTNVHRIFREGHDGLARVNVYRNTSNQSSIVSGTATKLQFNAEKEDTEGLFDSTTNYRFTAPFSGYYWIDTMVQWRTGTVDKQYITMIYRNGTKLTEFIDYSRYAVPYYFSVPYSTMVWLDKDNYIEVYVQHNEGINADIGWGDGKTYLTVVSM